MVDRPAPDFDDPRLDLDELLAQLVDRAQDVMATQSRLRGLLSASRSVIGDLDLDTVLHRIVSAATQLVDAQYGALGVIAPGGRGLERFVHVGVSAATVAAIGRLPEGKGLLGALIDEPVPIRLADLRSDPRSVGFPANHPSMKGFLGVPIRVRDEVFGNLYLGRDDDREFTEDDEELVLALAATAGVAIENARLFAEAQHRQQWLETSTNVTRELLSGAHDGPLRLIVRSVHELADADLVAVVQVADDGATLVATLAEGASAAQVTGWTYPRQDTLAELVMNTGTPIRLADAAAGYDGRRVLLTERVQLGPIMVLPLLGAERVRGALIVARSPGRHPFSAADMEMATTFGNQASVAWELADARRDQQMVALLEDRARIARDLHDHVIQQLFAAGLTVQATASHVGGVDAATLERVIDSIDDAIKQIRVSIFELRPAASGLRSAVIDVVAELRPGLGYEPQLAFDGPVDSLTTPELCSDATAVVREALTNVVKHAEATAASVLVRAGSDDLVIRVHDNGRGLGAPGRTSGLANLRGRAEARGGSLVVYDGHQGCGVTVEWRIPLPPGRAAPIG